MAVLDFHDTMLGLIAEVAITKLGEVKVKRIVCAVDCGVVINPKIVTAQIESGIAFGLTAAIKGQKTALPKNIFPVSKKFPKYFNDYSLFQAHT